MKKHSFIKVVSLLMCLLLVLPLFACSNTSGNGSDDSSKTHTGNTDTTAPEETEAKPDIPEEGDMKGAEINILAADWWGYTPLNVVDISPEEYLGETLNDAAYDRKIKIETQYKCEIVQISYTEPSAAATAVQNSVLAEDNAYDIALIRGTNFSSLLTGGYLRTLDDLQYVDFDKPWWNKNAYDALALVGKHYGVCGSFSTNELMTVWTVCFNKDMIDDYSLESPYDLVNSGEWTFDKAVEMAKTVAHDVDGDGKMTIDDVWGITYTTETVIGMLNGCGVTIAKLDSDGIPQITVDSESNITKIIDIYTKLFNEDYSVDTFKLNLYDKDGQIFGEGRNLFLFTATHLVDQLRQMDTEFGMIPYPKYNEDQAEYMPSTAGIFLPIVCVPKTVQNIDDIGLFMEAFAYEGSKTVTPAFYETILKGKTARDVESADMLDYIYGNISYDTGNLFNFGSFTGTLASMSPTTVASSMASNRSALDKAIEKLISEIIG